VLSKIHVHYEVAVKHLRFGRYCSLNCEDGEFDLGSSTSASVKLSLEAFYFVVCTFQRKFAFVISRKEYSMAKLPLNIMTREGNSEMFI
jgi:hypothetical protein